MRKLIFFFLLASAFSAFGQNKVLFDASQGETAANADWIPDADLFNLCFNPNATTGCGNEANPQQTPTPAQSGITATTGESYWKGALSAFAVDCVKKGYSVSTLPYNGQITFNNTANAQDLSLYKVFVVCEPNIRFATAEKTAIINWVYAGGSLLMIGNHNGSDRNSDGWDAPAIWNDLLTNNSVANNPFGISFDLTNFSQTTTNIITTANPISAGPQGTVTQFQYSSGTSMTLSPTANSTVRGVVYKTGSTQGNYNAMVAYAKYGSGRVVAIGDSSPIDDGTGDTNDNLYNGYSAAVSGNHRKLLINSLLWLQGVTNKGEVQPTEMAVTTPHAVAVTLYPNPTNGDILLNAAPGAQLTGLVVADLQGKIWIEQQQPVPTGNGQYVIEANGFPAGVYLVHYQEGGQVYSHKFVKL